MEFVLMAVAISLCRENVDDICPLALFCSETLFACLVESLKKVKSNINIARVSTWKKPGMQWRLYQEIRAKAKAYNIYEHQTLL
jgi:hypothetical protein